MTRQTVNPAHETKRTPSAARHPDYQNGQPLTRKREERKAAHGTSSWWLTDDFYREQKKQQGRMDGTDAKRPQVPDEAGR